MKRILITGKDSYIGNSFKEWVSQWPDKYHVDEVDTRDGAWEAFDFSGYDSILHVAGIAHIKETPKNEQLYYKVNRDLAVDVAKKAKAKGVKQFILLSSMSVYGLIEGTIDENTPLKPKSAYGRSKLEAEKIIGELQKTSFIVTIVRPPMVYGKNSKGNYSKLSKIAKKIPIFPKIENKRSMVYVDHLSEFIKNLIDRNMSGLYFPQNKEYVSTSDMVKKISKVYKKKIWMIKLYNPVIKKIITKLDIGQKIFGDLVYSKKISNVKFDYQTYDFLHTIKLTEKR